MILGLVFVIFRNFKMEFLFDGLCVTDHGCAIGDGFILTMVVICYHHGL